MTKKTLRGPPSRFHSLLAVGVGAIGAVASALLPTLAPALRIATGWGVGRAIRPGRGFAARRAPRILGLVITYLAATLSYVPNVLADFERARPPSMVDGDASTARAKREPAPVLPGEEPDERPLRGWIFGVIFAATLSLLYPFHADRIVHALVLVGAMLAAWLASARPARETSRETS